MLPRTGEGDAKHFRHSLSWLVSSAGKQSSGPGGGVAKSAKKRILI